ncbi:hypothetical protein GCM10011628_04700 [Lactobacillus acetotolerans DSM 20749 = JCM 3825]|nr:hypothetical protein GCM10011628_04700 [Lactobacillus acetotolerans DSM 20749 = JCM 3825]
MSFKGEMKQIGNHLQTGVSYMIPLVTASGLLMSLATICGGTNVSNNSFWGHGSCKVTWYNGIRFYSDYNCGIYFIFNC